MRYETIVTALSPLDRLRLPVIGAPLFIISVPDLVIAHVGELLERGWIG